MLVSVVVPVLDEAAALPALLDGLRTLDGTFEVIVVDGGSSDDTGALAATHPSRPTVVHSPAGRARQMNMGASVAVGDVLLFLHADTRLPRHAYAHMTEALADPKVLGGNFRLHFDGGDRFSQILGAWYALQRHSGIYYGDSAIWLRRRTFDSLGGFRELAIMEDYDLARRLQRAGQTVCLPGPAITSARRWQGHGLTRTVGSWMLIRWLYLAGVPAARLARLYPRIR
ncbi:MAG: TIGR04283 family arsenosugar biosynthesis glycosyltransferase [Solirubrobacterales bacterium]